MIKDELKEIRKSLGLSQGLFGIHFGGIPLRTVQNWEGGKSEPPEYVFYMIKRIFELEKNEKN